MDNPQVRLNKYLATRLGVSRREADSLIAAGQVTVNGHPAVTGARVDKNDKVCYNGKIIPFHTDYLYLAFHKPVGYVCSRRAQGPAPTLYDLLPPRYQKLKTVGRLDKDSSGLILLTNDGDFAFQMTHPKFRKTKIYEVELDKPLQPLHQQMISDFGVQLDDGPSKFKVIKDEAWVAENASFKDISRFSNPETYIPGEAESPFSRSFGAWQGEIKDGKLVDSRAFATTGAFDEASPVTTGASEEAREAASFPSYSVFLAEGRNRQIRRTFAALGYEVVKLHRTDFGKYHLGTLPPGHYQEIQP